MYMNRGGRRGGRNQIYADFHRLYEQFQRKCEVLDFVHGRCNNLKDDVRGISVELIDKKAQLAVKEKECLDLEGICSTLKEKCAEQDEIIKANNKEIKALKREIRIHKQRKNPVMPSKPLMYDTNSPSMPVAQFFEKYGIVDSTN